MAYTIPSYNAISVDLKPSGSTTVIIPSYNAINVDLSVDSVDVGEAVTPTNSDNARKRNNSILLAI